ncbi:MULTISPECIES: 2-oxoglutarate dehydrogenase complex dihydrolipoyllysine-residue succinyltransferase [unclassified Novosphingobium]|uniref:2-oxoglutarate dehydrogenase complex dihydrolipoyllysine-residue succinyltransferase n=1 Tax=unclassified Novosphingobium TaxID=2644732 RepID=UPI0008697BFC|nr:MULTISPECIES: 2-oxoglutarate dehydrogenase complex dihydrolipoyllysine-residue succinyltransferase [unclassified Novosphingobium]MBN9144105.1 2-oxoglutarate dehydrogenase complex dihydrolipoyllysine-residue succinyltransferase [Novosphingobium sp.]MDR6708564.1 2-oxoglutarate dehydrogenase E2 component (dihydrolipoamide succinyltransferase) [Novosphingobium sp. 1748]ODU78678.1 MAG: dihydrolipoamide succinyltransferase [Novosphingobium sp. SCN 63-17]OJX95064.1 MAG: dihydrolipoamide succinyltra
MSTEVKVPTLGESVSEATIGQWLKQPGETVALDEPIASLETDKVAIEVNAPVAGVLSQQLAAVGDTVTVSAIIAVIEEGAAGAAAPKAAAPAAAAPAPVAAPVTAAPAAGESTDPAVLSPAVRRAVLEYGIDPATIKGTGKDGRITKEDVVAAAQTKAASGAPTVPAAVAAPANERREERVKMTRLRQTIAKRLKSAQENAALLTTFNDVDMSAVMEARNRFKDSFEKKHGVKLGFMSFFAKASVLALKDIPAVNAQIQGDEIVYHDYVDISVAVSAPNGLVVPVVRDVDKMSFAGIEKAIADYGKKAKEGSLTMADMTGGTFTISNGGVFGGLMSTPIINPPQSAVLGLHRIEDRPVVRGGQIVIRPMMYIALSYDHRIIDGREAVTALKTIKEAIEDPTRLLIDL